ncbi:MAG: serine hydrolase [Candidatus Delongbacteria bacterium]|nr:serine hydrolase [Candidatus Delongbacteria bacterium]
MINETDYSQTTLSSEQENQIDAIFSQYNSNSSPGCSVAVIKDGQFAYKKSFGMADLGNDIPFTSDSKCELSSVSKQFTATCIALLSFEGKLDFDDDVRKYLPQLPDYGKTITIRHLLHHTSGIRDYRCLMRFPSPMNSDNYCNNEDGMKIMFKQKNLNFMPGKEFLYSNSGYLLLAEIIKVVSGISFKEYAEKNIFKPLGMHNSFVDEDSSTVVKNRVVSYKRDKENKYSSFLCANNDIGAKGVVSTINDLFLWNQNISDPKVGGKKLIKMLVTKGLLENNEEIEYSFGLRVYPYRNLSFIGHAGGYQGFRSMMMLFPEQKTSIFILCNLPDDIYALSNSVADIVLATEINAKNTSSESKTKPVIVNLSKEELDKYCGYFWCEEAQLVRKVYIKDGCLFYWRDEGNESQLMPISKNELVMINQNSEVRLKYDFNGNSKKISFHQNNNHTIRLNSYKPIDFNMEYLNKFIGNYVCEELDGNFKLKIESGKLTYCIENEIIHQLKPIFQDRFKFEEEDCYIKFIYNDKKDITGFKLDSVRVKNLYFVKQ